MKLKLVYKGGKGSGHHGHVGRPGKIGGSQPGTGGGSGSGKMTAGDIKSKYPNVYQGINDLAADNIPAPYEIDSDYEIPSKYHDAIVEANKLLGYAYSVDLEDEVSEREWEDIYEGDDTEWEAFRDSPVAEMFLFGEQRGAEFLEQHFNKKGYDATAVSELFNEIFDGELRDIIKVEDIMFPWMEGYDSSKWERE